MSIVSWLCLSTFLQRSWHSSNKAKASSQELLAMNRTLNELDISMNLGGLWVKCWCYGDFVLVTRRNKKNPVVSEQKLMAAEFVGRRQTHFNWKVVV